MTDSHDFLSRGSALERGDGRQYRVVDRLECLRDHAGAYEPRGVARSERNHLPSPSLRYRKRNQIAHEIDDISMIIARSNPVDGEFADGLAILDGQVDRAADTRMESKIFGQRRRNDAFIERRFNQGISLHFLSVPGQLGADIERRSIKASFQRLCPNILDSI